MPRHLSRDDDVGGFTYQSGAKANSTGPDRITPFSQRLHESVDAACRTDIFAPGAPIQSSGIANDNAESLQHGTSQNQLSVSDARTT